MSEIKRIGILTSGGDCPGLNAVIRSVVRAAEAESWEVVGFRDGYEGLLNPVRFEVLNRARTAGIMHLGGTILGTVNKGRFVAKVRGGERAMLDPEIVDEASRTMRDNGIDALVAVGGDGSLTTALQLYQAGFPVIGVPKTIDNDLEATQMTFGFDSAVACVADSLDRLHTTATSHQRIMVLEVMGRHAGWIALYGGLAGGADVILIPEIPFSIDSVVSFIKSRIADGCRSTMVVVAEGAAPKKGKALIHETQSGEYRLGGIGDFIGREIASRVDREVRTCVLGHLQRGGSATPLDRILGTRFGVKAVQLIKERKFGCMVNYRNYSVGSVPIAEAVHKLRKVDPLGEYVTTAKAVGICFGDEDCINPVPPSE